MTLSWQLVIFLEGLNVSCLPAAWEKWSSFSLQIIILMSKCFGERTCQLNLLPVASGLPYSFLDMESGHPGLKITQSGGKQKLLRAILSQTNIDLVVTPNTKHLGCLFLIEESTTLGADYNVKVSKAAWLQWSISSPWLSSFIRAAAAAAGFKEKKKQLLRLHLTVSYLSLYFSLSSVFEQTQGIWLCL